MMKRVPFLLAMLGLLSLTIAGPVMAAAPGNDTYATRSVIASVPFSDSVDTSGATTDADDAELNAQCGAPATDASVWYAVTATSDAGLLVEVYDSSYTAGVIVATGTPGAFSVLACGPGAVSFPTATGETYTLLVFDDQGDGAGNGGTLVINVSDVPPPPTLDVTISNTGSFNAKTGSATIRGTVTCTGGEEFGKNFIDIQVSQAIGRVRISGEAFTEFACDGIAHPWAAEVFGSGKFAGGKATVTMFAAACGAGGCDDVEATGVAVSLRK